LNKERIMPTEASVMGLFKDEAAAVSAIEGLKDSPWSLRSVHSPIPSHKIAQALKLKKSKVGWFTLAGGITGLFSGFLLAAFTAAQWHLVIGGKPVIAPIPFFIVGFEFTILFAIFGNVVGLIHQMQLPDFKGFERYDPRCSGEHIGILAACGAEDVDGLAVFFKNKGGEIRVFADESVAED
jgi:molybdopterin-containing oxidoreductase family membrane subunit